MRQAYNPTIFDRIASYTASFPRKTAVGLILAVALFAFEIFNFDTTRYALRDLLGPIQFASIEWAAILAIAFCAIDFAGLARIFTREEGSAEPKEVWYLMGAWLLGATMNAVMTWWAVSLTLLENEFGNEILSREELLRIVPVFVAVLVWLTRILFIGSFTVAGEHFFEFSGTGQSTTQNYRQPTTQQKKSRATSKPKPRQTKKATPKKAASRPAPRRTKPAPKPKSRQQAPGYSSQYDDMQDFADEFDEVVYEDMDYPVQQQHSQQTQQGPRHNNRPNPKPIARRKPAQTPQPRHSRIKQRPPRPNGGGPRRQ